MQSLVPQMSVENSCLQLLIEAAEVPMEIIIVGANKNWFMKLKIGKLRDEVSLWVLKSQI